MQSPTFRCPFFWRFLYSKSYILLQSIDMKRNQLLREANSDATNTPSCQPLSSARMKKYVILALKALRKVKPSLTKTVQASFWPIPRQTGKKRKQLWKFDLPISSPFLWNQRSTKMLIANETSNTWPWLIITSHDVSTTNHRSRSTFKDCIENCPARIRTQLRMNSSLFESLFILWSAFFRERRRFLSKVTV